MDLRVLGPPTGGRSAGRRPRSLERAVILSHDALPGWFSSLRGADACDTRCDLSSAVITDDRARTVAIRLRHRDPTLPYPSSSASVRSSRARAMSGARLWRGRLSAAWRSGVSTRFPSRIAGAPLLGTDYMFLSVRTPPFDDVLVPGFDYFVPARDARNHAQIGVFGWIADFPTPATFFDPTLSCAGDAAEASFNLSRSCRPSIDRQVAAALRAEGPAAERAWREATRRPTDLAPAVPLVSRRRSYFTSARVGDVQQSAMFGVMLDRAWVR